MTIVILIAYVLVGVALAGGWISTELRAEPRSRLLLSFFIILLGWPVLLAIVLFLAAIARRIDPYQRNGA